MSHKLLIIEDDPYVIRLYMRLFSLEHFDVKVAHNGEIGLADAVSFQPDLILLDVMMPVMNGLETLKHLKQQPSTKGIPVVMLTNFGEEKIVQIAMEYGAESYLIKSNFAPNRLQAEVRKYLNGSKTRVISDPLAHFPALSSGKI